MLSDKKETALLCLPEVPVEPGFLDDAISSIEGFLPRDIPLRATYRVRPSEGVRAVLAKRGVSVDALKRAAGRDGRYLLFYFSGCDPAHVRRRRSCSHLFEISGDGIIKLASGELPAFYHRHKETHIFNRNGAGRDQTFTYFPYGYLYNYFGAGPVNDMGFRITADPEALKRRARDHKVIAMFGASGLFSLHTTFERCFTSLLEKALNRAGLKNTYTVLNFGIGGCVLLNEIIAYLLYAQQLEPDIVIAHDGYNDLRFGIISDSHLLKKYRVTYLGNLEYWSQLLHDTETEQLPYFSDDVPIVNTPSQSIMAYKSRLLQFKGIVESNGTRFVSALQPMIWSKKTPSRTERDSIVENSRFTKQSRFWSANQKMPFLYERYTRAIRDEEVPLFFNLHEHFNRYGEETTLFKDFVHTNGEGDRVLAEAYFDYLTERKLVE